MRRYAFTILVEQLAVSFVDYLHELVVEDTGDAELQVGKDGEAEIIAIFITQRFNLLKEDVLLLL